MCWSTSKRPVLQVATKDIPVFKIVHKSLRSVYHHFQYKVGETYKHGRALYVGFDWKICQGFHSFSKEHTKIQIKNGYIDIINDSCVIDSYISGRNIIIDCIIPAGSTYYINEYGVIVSDAIKVVKKRFKFLLKLKQLLCVG